MKMQGRYSGAAQRGVISGLPCHSDQSGFRAEGWAELIPIPAPTVIEIPRAQAVWLKREPVQSGSPPSRQGQTTSGSHTLDSVLQTIFTSGVSDPRAVLWPSSSVSKEATTEQNRSNSNNKKGTDAVGADYLVLLQGPVIRWS